MADHDDTPPAQDADVAEAHPLEPVRAHGDALRRGAWWALLALTIVAWIAAFTYLRAWVPDEVYRRQLAALSDGEDFAQTVPALCQKAQGRQEVRARWATLADAPERRDQLERVMLQAGCFDLLDAASATTFFRRHGHWALDAAPGLGAPVDAARLLDVLEHGQVAAQRRAAQLLIEQRDALDADQRARALSLAAERFRDPWGLDLLLAFDGPEVAPLLWDRYLEVRGERPTSDQDATPSDQDAAPTDEDGAAADGDAAADGGLTPDSDAALADGAAAPDVVDGAARAAREARLEARLYAEVQRRWRDLPEAAREALMARWLEVRWYVRRAGSMSQPQPIMVEARWRGEALVGPLAESVLYLRASRFEVDGAEALLDEGAVTSVIGSVTLSEPSRWRRVVDLQPLLNEKAEHALAGALEVVLLPAAARGAQVVEPLTGVLDDAWREQALYVAEQPFGPRSYKVYRGVDYGPPHTLHERALDRQVASHLDVSLLLPESVALRVDGEVVTGKPAVTYRHGLFNEVLIERRGPLDADLALRVQAALQGSRFAAASDHGWSDLGAGTMLASEDGVTIPIDLAPVCPDRGACEVVLRLRTSLRVARTDPRIESYWGGQDSKPALDVGQVVFEVQNAAPGHQWHEMQRRVLELQTGARALR